MRYFFYLGEWAYNKISLFTLIILISIGYCHSIWLSTAVADDIPSGCGTNFCICPETRNQCNPGQPCDYNTTICNTNEKNPIQPGEECCPSNKPNNTYSCVDGKCQKGQGTKTLSECQKSCSAKVSSSIELKFHDKETIPEGYELFVSGQCNNKESGNNILTFVNNSVSCTKVQTKTTSSDTGHFYQFKKNSVEQSQQSQFIKLTGNITSGRLYFYLQKVANEKPKGNPILKQLNGSIEQPKPGDACIPPFAVIEFTQDTKQQRVYVDGTVIDGLSSVIANMEFGDASDKKISGF